MIDTRVVTVAFQPDELANHFENARQAASARATVTMGTLSLCALSVDEIKSCYRISHTPNDIISYFCIRVYNRSQKTMKIVPTCTTNRT
jgi:hypothetical protein